MRTLTQREIVDKDFSNKLRGYDPEEVDQFLDIIIQDYKSFQEEIDELRADNDRLIEQLDKNSKQTRTQNQNSNQATVTNFDILKRLSNLERHVFGSKLDAEGHKED